jgi:hypothetical protein
MTFSILRTAVLGATIAMSPAVSFAQEVFGTIEASLDGEDRSWFLTTQDKESQSFGMTVAIANLQSFTLWGQTSAETVNEMKGSLLLGFDVATVGGNVIPLNVSVTYLADGWKSGWRADEESGVVFTLTTLEERDGGVYVEGSFTSVAGYAEPLDGEEIDASRTMEINGSFKATLPPFVLSES